MEGCWGGRGRRRGFFIRSTLLLPWERRLSFFCFYEAYTLAQRGPIFYFKRYQYLFETPTTVPSRVGDNNDLFLISFIHSMDEVAGSPSCFWFYFWGVGRACALCYLIKSDREVEKKKKKQEWKEEDSLHDVQYGGPRQGSGFEALRKRPFRHRSSVHTVFIYILSTFSGPWSCVVSHGCAR